MGISRAITALCEKGYVVGWFRTWYPWRGKDRPYAASWGEECELGIINGETPFSSDRESSRRPRLVWLQLTEQGMHHCRKAFPDLAKPVAGCYAEFPYLTE